MSSPPSAVDVTSTSPPSSSTKVIGQIRKMARRFSETFIDKSGPRHSAIPDNLMSSSKPPIYQHDADTGQLAIGRITMADLTATHGTPLHVYDANRIADNYYDAIKALRSVFGADRSSKYSICHPVNDEELIGLLNVHGKLGSDFRVESVRAFDRCHRAGIDSGRVILSGIGKTREQIRFAIEKGVNFITIESVADVEKVEQEASKQNKTQNVALRINTDLDVEAAGGRKFILQPSDVSEISARIRASASLNLKGLSSHLESSLGSAEQLAEQRDKLLQIADQIREETRDCIDLVHLCGPIGTRFLEKTVGPIAERGLQLILELQPYAVTGDAALLITEVQSTTEVKVKLAVQNYAVVDAQLGDHSRHCGTTSDRRDVVPVKWVNEVGDSVKYKVVASPHGQAVCKELASNGKVQPGDLLAICDTGSCVLPAGVVTLLVTESVSVIRAKDTDSDRFPGETVAAELDLKAPDTAEVDGNGNDDTAAK